MKRNGIPLLWTKYVKEFKEEEVVVKGFKPNIFYKIIDGSSKGPDFTGLVKLIEGDSEGFEITGGLEYVYKNSKGLKITGLVNLVDGISEGINLTGVLNYSGNVNNYLIQYGTLRNTVKKVSNEAFVLQIGLQNKIENQKHFFINIKGKENLPRILGLK